MRLIIAGSRTLDDELVYAELVKLRIENHPMITATEIISGRCTTGSDLAGENYADFYGISLKLFPADWELYGRAAGPIRNQQMAEYGDALLLVWDGSSRGSLGMKREMEKLNKPIYEIIIKE